MGRASAAKRNRKAVTYWHGGAPGIEVGQFVLPPSKHATAAALHAEPDHERRIWSGSRSKVYITPHRDLAEAYAINVMSDGRSVGWLYRVSPVGAPQHDDDYRRGVSVMANMAKVLEVVERDYSGATPQDANRLAGPFQGWDDGTPIYTERGAMLPNAHLEALGVTSAQLEARFGLWPDVDPVLETLEREVNALGPPMSQAAFEERLAAVRAARRPR